MGIRMIFCILLTILSMFIFAFIPAFNWAGGKQISLYNQFIPSGQWFEFALHLGALSLIVFLALWVLLVIKRSP